MPTSLTVMRRKKEKKKKGAFGEAPGLYLLIYRICPSRCGGQQHGRGPAAQRPPRGVFGEVAVPWCHTAPLHYRRVCSLALSPLQGGRGCFPSLLQHGLEKNFKLKANGKAELSPWLLGVREGLPGPGSCPCPCPCAFPAGMGPCSSPGEGG